MPKIKQQQEIRTIKAFNHYAENLEAKIAKSTKTLNLSNHEKFHFTQTYVFSEDLVAVLAETYTDESSQELFKKFLGEFSCIIDTPENIILLYEALRGRTKDRKDSEGSNRYFKLNFMKRSNIAFIHKNLQFCYTIEPHTSLELNQEELLSKSKKSLKEISDSLQEIAYFHIEKIKLAQSSSSKRTLPFEESEQNPPSKKPGYLQTFANTLRTTQRELTEEKEKTKALSEQLSIAQQNIKTLQKELSETKQQSTITQDLVTQQKQTTDWLLSQLQLVISNVNTHGQAIIAIDKLTNTNICLQNQFPHFEAIQEIPLNHPLENSHGSTQKTTQQNGSAPSTHFQGLNPARSGTSFFDETSHQQNTTATTPTHFRTFNLAQSEEQ